MNDRIFVAEQHAQQMSDCSDKRFMRAMQAKELTPARLCGKFCEVAVRRLKGRWS
jgi:hypothetical protein